MAHTIDITNRSFWYDFQRGEQEQISAYKIRLIKNY